MSEFFNSFLHSSERLHDENLEPFAELCAQGPTCLVGINIRIKQEKIMQSIYGNG